MEGSMKIKRPQGARRKMLLHVHIKKVLGKASEGIFTRSAVDPYGMSIS